MANTIKESFEQTDFFEDIKPTKGIGRKGGNDTIITGNFPAVFAVFPLFKYTQDRQRYDTTYDAPETFATVNGMDYLRVGPGLDTRDLATLVAKLSLSQTKRMAGPSYIHEGMHGRPTGVSSLRQINAAMGKGIGGRDLKKTKESIDRLDATMIWEKEVGRDWGGVGGKEQDLGRQKIISIQSETSREYLNRNVQWTIEDILVRALRERALSLDLNLFSRLNDFRKHAYVYLAAQPDEATLRVEDLANGIGYQGDLDNLRMKTKARANREDFFEILKKEAGYTTLRLASRGSVIQLVRSKRADDKSNPDDG